LVSIKRDQATANSGIVVELKLEILNLMLNMVLWPEWNFKSIEQKAWHRLVKLKRPAQRMIDFTKA
jgi:hypothetical protein